MRRAAVNAASDSVDHRSTMSACERLDVPLADGRHLRVRRTPGRGRPAVLLHGLLDDAAGWSQVMERSTHPCLAFDLPGFGGSSAPLRLAHLAALPGVRHALQAALPLGLANPLVVTAAYTTFVAHRRLPPSELVARLRRASLQSGRGARMAVEAVDHAGRDRDGLGQRRAAFEGPVSALWGERDALVPVAHAAGVLRAFPQASVEVWPAMGHHPQRERPEAPDEFLGRALWRSRVRSARNRRDEPRPVGTPPAGCAAPGSSSRSSLSA
jgi:pimeloyl-ACP methyl ester carboxylesterase